MLTPREKKQLQKEVNAVRGQLDALERLLHQDTPTVRELHEQFQAVEGKIRRAVHTALDDVLRRHLALTLVSSLDACPGACAYCDQLEAVRQRYPVLTIGEVVAEIDALKK